MQIHINERGVGIISEQHYKNIGYLSRCNVVVCLGEIKYNNIFGAPTYALEDGVSLINNIFVVSGNTKEVVRFLSKHDPNSSRPIIYIGEPSTEVAELLGILQRLSDLVAVVSKSHDIFKRKEAYGIKVDKSDKKHKLIHFEFLKGEIKPPNFLKLDLEPQLKNKKKEE